MLDNIPRYDESHQLEIMLDGDPAERFTLAGEPDPEDIKDLKGLLKEVDLAGRRRNLDAHWRVRLAVPAGMHDVAATFLGKAPVLTEATRTEAFEPLRLALKEPLERRYKAGFFNDDTRAGPYLASLTVTGPFQIVRAAAAEDYRFNALLTNIVKSLPFQARRSSGPPAAARPTVASAR